MAKTTDLVADATDILTEYTREVYRVAREAAKEAADASCEQLKKTSPVRKGKGGGKYRRGWKVKKQTNGILTSYIVYNGAKPGMTHLLENGHLIRNQVGTWGRVAANRHIGPAAETGIQRFEQEVKSRLRGN